MFEIIRTNQFIKDAKLQKKRGKNLNKLVAVIEILSKKEELTPKHKPHKLIGNWKNWSECHIESDWLLISAIQGKELILARTGSHSDLFE